MRKRSFYFALLGALALLAAGGMPAGGSRAQGNEQAMRRMLGTWAINFVVRVSPKGNDFNLPHRHKFDFVEDDGEQTVTAREILNIRVPGSWRLSETGEEFSATFELTCGEGITCGTVLMRGGFESDGHMSGRAIIFWDTPDDSTPTGFDTVAGTFTGEKCGDVRAAHDTGGCDAP
jgi:hypothetical protein